MYVYCAALVISLCLSAPQTQSRVVITPAVVVRMDRQDAISWGLAQSRVLGKSSLPCEPLLGDGGDKVPSQSVHRVRETLGHVHSS